MKKGFFVCLFASSMLAAMPVRAAQVNWYKMKPLIGVDFYDWSPGFWRGGNPPGAGDDVGFDLEYHDPEYRIPTTIIYNVSDDIVFHEIHISDKSNQAPITLSLGTGYTLSATSVILGVSNTNNKQGSLVLSGGALESDYVSISLTGNILHLAGTNTVRENLTNQGTYQLSGGALTVGATLYVGGGTFTQDGGDNYTNLLSVGNWDVGTYSLGGLGRLVATTERVGNASTGTFFQTGGTNDVTGTLSIGYDAHGTYYLSGGMLGVNFLTIGHNALGGFYQSGGINTSASIGIGSWVSSNGSSYYLSGGSLRAGSLTVGNSGTGYFGHTLGTSNVGELSLGANGATGTYRLEGSGARNSTLLTARNEYIGYSGTGVFDHYGNFDGDHTVGQLFLGYENDSDGTYSMVGNVLLAAGDLVVGRAGKGTFTQNRGTNLLGAVVLNEGGAPVGTGTLTIGELDGGSGKYLMDPLPSGTPELRASTEVIGNYGIGEFRQFGGKNTVAGDLYLGRYATTGVGSYTLSGDSSSLVAVNEYIGDAGSGTFTHSGGGNELSGDLHIGRTADGIGSYTLSGSGFFSSTRLTAVNEYVGVGGTGTFTQSGGTNQLSGSLFLGGNNIGSGGSGTYILSGGNLWTQASEYVGSGGTGTFTHTGGSNQVANILTVGANGTYTLSGVGYETSLRAGGIINNGTFNYSGGDLSIQGYAIEGDVNDPYSRTYIDPKFTNNGTLNISGTGERSFFAPVINNGTMNATGTTVTFSGVFTNSGTMKVTGSTVTFNGNFINNGEYNSDPSTTMANTIVIGSTGYLIGGQGDQWIVSNDFVNESAQNTLWNTKTSLLQFTGGANHALHIPGTVAGGYANNFAWGTLDLTGGSLNLQDGNDVSGAALYVGEILGVLLSEGSVTNITGNGFNIYYDRAFAGNGYLGGLQYALTGGGYLMAAAPVPIPGSLLLFGSGLLGLIGIGRKRRRMP